MTTVWRKATNRIIVMLYKRPAQMPFNAYFRKNQSTMKTLAEFKASLNLEQPASELSVQLKSLWYDGKGDWHQAHAKLITWMIRHLRGYMPTCTVKKVIS